MLRRCAKKYKCLKKMGEKNNTEKVYTATPVSPGIAIGEAYILMEGLPKTIPFYRIAKDDIIREYERFNRARAKLIREFEELLVDEQALLSTEETEILEAYKLMLEDERLISDVQREIENSMINAEQALSRISKRYKKLFMEFDDDIFRERANDIIDIAKRLLYKLLFIEGVQTLNPAKSIIVAKELTPNITVRLDKGNALGFLVERCGLTSHTAIIARNLSIPAVSNIKAPDEIFKNSETLIIDGFEGVVISNPTPETLEKYKNKLSDFEEYKNNLKGLIKKGSTTLDRHSVKLYANVGTLNDMHLASFYNAAGIGLLRTEIMYMEESTMPTEERLYETFSRMFKTFSKEITVRTLDIGGDKYLPYLPQEEEKNPYLGLRAVKIFRKHPDIIIDQIKAILRAAVFNPKVQIMYPMITGKSDILFLKEMYANAVQQLENENKEYAHVKQGIMIELPSIVIVLEQILKYVDFVSVGSNDLVQYILAVDRNNEFVSKYYEPHHPAIIQTLSRIAEVAQKHKKSLAVCGELAADQQFAAFLIGLGITKLSMSPVLIPQVKNIVRKVKYADLKRFAGEVVALDDTERIKEEFNVFFEHFVNN